MVILLMKNARSSPALPEPAERALQQLGERLRAHRMARGWTIADISARLLCAPNTWKALEGGKPGTSVGVLAHALWLLGQIDGLDAVAPAPLSLPGKRVRRSAGAPTAGRIAGDELDF